MAIEKKGGRKRIPRKAVDTAVSELETQVDLAADGVTTLMGAITNLAPTLNALLAKGWTLGEAAALASQFLERVISAPTLGSYLRRIEEKGRSVPADGFKLEASKAGQSHDVPIGPTSPAITELTSPPSLPQASDLATTHTPIAQQEVTVGNTPRSSGLGKAPTFSVPPRNRPARGV